MLSFFIAETSEIIAEGNVRYGRKRGMIEAVKIESKSFLYVLIFKLLKSHKTICLRVLFHQAL